MSGKRVKKRRKKEEEEQKLKRHDATKHNERKEKERVMVGCPKSPNAF